MAKPIMLIPVGSSVGLTSVSLGLVRAIEQQAIDVGFYKPISQPRDNDMGPEKSTEIIRNTSNIEPPRPLDLSFAEQMFSDGRADVLLEEIVGRLQSYAGDGQIVVVEGLVPTRDKGYINRLNRMIAGAIGADVVFVTTPSTYSNEHLEDLLEIAINHYGGINNEKVLGCIFNKVAPPTDKYGHIGLDVKELPTEQHFLQEVKRIKSLPLFIKSHFNLLGIVPWQFDMVAPRVKDLAEFMNAEVLNEGDYEHRRLRSINFCARTVSNMLSHFNPNTLIVTPGDRSDVIVATCLSVMNGIKIGAILLTGGITPDDKIMKLCQQALGTGVPLLLTDGDTWQTSIKLQHFNFEVPVDDEQRIEKVKNHTAQHIDKEWITSFAEAESQHRKLSPPAFRYLLTERARKANKTIVLPEGNEPRTIKAAAICGERKIARTVLLGDKQEILRIAEHQGVELNDYVRIVEPESIIDQYVAPMVELRKHKGLTDVVAEEQLQDTVVLGTMMLAENEVDGLVSGAVNTTANTIRPPLQLIKTAPDCSLVSSVFFMLLPEQVLVYGDCAINPDPTAEQLADIAIQSAESAISFGIEPKVAMISYSTGTSGQGDDVEKVRKATEIAKEKRPDLLIDGPLQYDAAVMANVARKKAPNSPVAGQATVFIFPDLNTGNTTYKAVQRSADLVSIGPMLQGMGKPVNDLSRGALVEDIVYTIALTAIQAAQH
ncbi:phosphate acetyltransferase [Endozoicomonas sp. G2_1]|uniref:phosphate acetyltransferase n=1 Tax=Endozoicomonas sp. G2_1 TaxID=2821091 RepID=UPI001AD9BF5D|nr:phosphate acetyltransferase [Endozoicomonas sp. G2_1]MBO9491781.1 phosphate acetyltransferase [Endozoicomonas sp. G2_1]